MQGKDFAGTVPVIVSEEKNAKDYNDAIQILYAVSDYKGEFEKEIFQAYCHALPEVKEGGLYYEQRKAARDSDLENCLSFKEDKQALSDLNSIIQSMHADKKTRLSVSDFGQAVLEMGRDVQESPVIKPPKIEHSFEFKP